MFYLEVELGQKGGPPRLTPIQLLDLHEPFKVVMVCKHLNRMRGAFAVVAPLLEGLYNGEELLIIGLVVLLGVDKLARPKRDGVLLAIFTVSVVQL
jgi:hypothetical protein